MERLTRPDLTDVWASEGSLAEPSQEQIRNGWTLNQYPPSEIANTLQRKVELGLKYILQVGVPEWSPFEYYIPSVSLVSYEGTHYKAISPTVGLAPSDDKSGWFPAWEEHGATDDLREEIDRIRTRDGYLEHYVQNANPIMYAKAQAPAFLSELGEGTERGFLFRRTKETGVQTLGDGSLVFKVDGTTNGRIKSVPPTLDMDDDTLVTTKLLKQALEEVTKTSRIPIGWSVITQSSKPPSDKDQLGYGTWVQDCQGRAIVGVSAKAGDPTWTKVVNNVAGAFTVLLGVQHIPAHNHTMEVTQWLHGRDGRRGSTACWSDGDVTDTGTRRPTDADKIIGSTGGGEAHDNVQPSHTKYIWTRTA